MSLKRMAMKMAMAYAATKGVQAFRRGGGMAGLQQSLRQMQGGAGGGGGMQGRVGGTGASAGGLGSMLGALGGGSGAQGGLGGLMGALSGAGGTGRGSAMGGGMSGAGMGGLLGGLAAMAGGSQAIGRPEEEQTRLVEQGPADETTAGVMIRAMAQAVQADGQIDDEERRILMEVLDDANDPGDREAVEAALREPVDPEGLAREVPKGREAEVYAAALTAIDPDRPAERDYLSRLANGLDLRPSEVRDLHDAQDKPL